jgi:hypothetical protein
VSSRWRAFRRRQYEWGYQFGLRFAAGVVACIAGLAAGVVVAAGFWMYCVLWGDTNYVEAYAGVVAVGVAAASIVGGIVHRALHP